MSDRKKSFGVVRAKEEGVAEIGCTAEIITVAKKYPDGRMDIVTEGRERFEVMQVNQERLFLQADVLSSARRTGRLPRRKSPSSETAGKSYNWPGPIRRPCESDNHALAFIWSDRFL
jgi:hypothetical protein